jgi:hypothetical protein
MPSALIWSRHKRWRLNWYLSKTAFAQPIPDVRGWGTLAMVFAAVNRRLGSHARNRVLSSVPFLGIMDGFQPAFHHSRAAVRYRSQRGVGAMEREEAVSKDSALAGTKSRVVVTSNGSLAKWLYTTLR